MRGKNLIWASLLTVLVLATGMIGIAVAPTATKMSVDPGNFGMVNAGTYLVADIRVDDVYGLSGWEFKLEWDPFVLKIESIVEGPFLKSVGPTLFNYRFSPFGESVRAGCALMVADTASGSGVLATVTLKAIGAGSTDIDLRETELRDYYVMPIDHAVFDGKVSVHIGIEADTVWPDQNLWIISEEGPQPGINNLYAEVTNHGTIDAYAYVVFTGFDMTGAIIKFQTNSDFVPSGGSVTLQNSGFNATDLGLGIYRLTARCYWSYDELFTQEFYGFKTKPIKIQVRD